MPEDDPQKSTVLHGSVLLLLLSYNRCLRMTLRNPWCYTEACYCKEAASRLIVHDFGCMVFGDHLLMG